MAKVKKEKLDREYLAECLHVALRKACDSTPTSIAWNVIHLLSKETWGEYVELVFSALRGKKSNEDIVNAVKRSSLGWHIMADYSGVALRCAFKLFDDDDWYGYSSLLFDFEMPV